MVFELRTLGLAAIILSQVALNGACYSGGDRATFVEILPDATPAEGGAPPVDASADSPGLLPSDAAPVEPINRIRVRIAGIQFQLQSGTNVRGRFFPVRFITTFQRLSGLPGSEIQSLRFMAYDRYDVSLVPDRALGSRMRLQPSVTSQRVPVGDPIEGELLQQWQFLVPGTYGPSPSALEFEFRWPSSQRTDLMRYIASRSSHPDPVCQFIAALTYSDPTVRPEGYAIEDFRFGLRVNDLSQVYLPSDFIYMLNCNQRRDGPGFNLNGIIAFHFGPPGGQ